MQRIIYQRPEVKIPEGNIVYDLDGVKEVVKRNTTLDPDKADVTEARDGDGALATASFEEKGNPALSDVRIIYLSRRAFEGLLSGSNAPELQPQISEVSSLRRFFENQHVAGLLLEYRGQLFSRLIKTLYSSEEAARAFALRGSSQFE